MVPDDKHFDSAGDFKAPIRAQIERAGYDRNNWTDRYNRNDSDVR